MTEVIKYSNFEIPRKAIHSLSSNVNDSFPVENLHIGSSSLLYKSGSKTTETYQLYDLGPGVTLSADHIILTGLKLILSQVDTVTIKLQGSTDNFDGSVVTVDTMTDLELDDLVGMDGDAYISTFSESTAYRYWRVLTTTPEACYHMFRKISFGDFFTMGDRSPQHGYQAPINAPRELFQTQGGAVFGSGSGRRGRSFNFNYNGLDDDIRISFEDEILKYAEDVPVFLYEANPSTAKTLAGKGIVIGKIAGAEHSSPNADFNVYSVQLLEDVVS